MLRSHSGVRRPVASCDATSFCSASILKKQLTEDPLAIMAQIAVKNLSRHVTSLPGVFEQTAMQLRLIVTSSPRIIYDAQETKAFSSCIL